MSTKPTNETRHRWTPADRAKLLTLSARYTTVGEATDGSYVEMGMPRNAVYAQLYDLFLRGKAPHLGLSREAKTDFSPAFARALRELIRVMRVEAATDCLVTVTAEKTSVQVVRRAATVDLDL